MSLSVSTGPVPASMNPTGEVTYGVTFLTGATDVFPAVCGLPSRESFIITGARDVAEVLDWVRDHLPGADLLRAELSALAPGAEHGTLLWSVMPDTPWARDVGTSSY